MRSHGYALLVVLLCAPAVGAGSTPATPKNSRPKKSARTTAALPVTTASPQARKLFQKAMVDLEYMRADRALANWRAAAQQDPNFALAHLFVSYGTRDPEEESRARARAKQLAPRVTPGERLLIRWLGGMRENDYVSAIAAMNDLVAQYPKDKRLLFLAGRWMVQQERYEQGAALLERAVAQAPNYPAAVNELGYAYAFGGDFDKGFAMMEKYVALEPDEPNPEDSYGEILRLAGRFDAALEHYRKAVKIDPDFGSELGIADTYALMGDEAQARAQYARALLFCKDDAARIDYEMQAATTWVREGKAEQAGLAFREVAHHAHEAGLGHREARAHRMAALYAPDHASAWKHLGEAENALAERHTIAPSDKNEEQARILRARATLAAQAQDSPAAVKALNQLEEMAAGSRSQVVQRSYHAAAGAVLVAQDQYAEAIPHLEEDKDDPLSLQLLWRAYNKTGARAASAALEKRLANLNLPTLEQALVVPKFRASLKAQNQEP
jgi:tetratricopeptide (TPR) repeat protein